MIMVPQKGKKSTVLCRIFRKKYTNEQLIYNLGNEIHTHNTSEISMYFYVNYNDYLYFS